MRNWLSSLLSCIAVALCSAGTSSATQLGEWPAEPESQATNLSGLSPEFAKDLSGAVWNPATRTLWLCRNGPGKKSKMWVLEEGGERGMRPAVSNGHKGEWNELGDSEGITFADYEEEVVYVLIEGEETIHELDVSTYGETVVRRVYDTRPFLPLDGSDGAEGITFVTDEHLAAAGFVDSAGVARVSRLGMGGLMFVGHQNGGGIYAFDLDRETGAVEFVGEYRVLTKPNAADSVLSKVVGLEFDRSTGKLFVLHGLDDQAVLSMTDLSSSPVAGEKFRGFSDSVSHLAPSSRQFEGLAMVPAGGSSPTGRTVFLTVDDGESTALFRYDRFNLGGAEVESETADQKPAASSKPAPNVWNMLFSVIGGLGLFLVGMRHLSDGMQAIAGSRLRSMISAATNNRFLALGVGTVATCLVQSSSITTVIVIGFVNSGLMSLTEAIGVIMGANIGTTITGWILVLKVGKYGLPILGVAAFFYLFSKKERWRFIAMAVMGLGMIFFGLELMKNGVKPMRSIPVFQEAFAWFAADSYLGVLKCAALGCILTFLVQSSSATLGITISLACTGTIPFETAAALVLGENVGTTITAWLASLGATAVARRAAYAHVIFNLVGVFWVTLVFGPYIRLIGRVVDWNSGVDIFASDFILENTDIAFVTTMAFSIAVVHTGFNLANTGLFLGFLPQLAALLERYVPDRSGQSAHHLSLDASLSSPGISIQQSHAAIAKMSDEIEEMLGWTRQLVASGKPDRALADNVFEYERRMDDMQSEVIEFLTELLTSEAPHEVAVEARQQLRIVDEYESVSDYISDIAKARLRLENSNLDFSSIERECVLSLHDSVAEYVDMISHGFRDPAARNLSRAISQSIGIKRAAKEMRSDHLKSLSTDRIDPIRSMVYSTMLISYRKVKDHALNIAESLDAT